MRYLRIFLALLVLLWPVLAEAADNTWTAAIDGDGTKGGNWSLGHVPTTDESAILDGGTSVADCALGTLDCDGIIVEDDYTGALMLAAAVTLVYGVQIDTSCTGTIQFNSTVIIDGDDIEGQEFAVYAAGATIGFGDNFLLSLAGNSDVDVYGNASGDPTNIKKVQINKPGGDVLVDDIQAELQAVSLVGDLTVDDSILTSASAAKSITGDVNISDGDNNVNLGAATWTITDGTFTWVNCGTFDSDTSTLVLDGTCVLHGSSVYAKRLNNVTVNADATVSMTANANHAGTLLVNGTLNMTDGDWYSRKAVQVGSGGHITGASHDLIFYESAAGGGITSMAADATIDCQSIYCQNSYVTTAIVAGDYDTDLYIAGSDGTKGITLGAGDFTFDSIRLRNSGTSTTIDTNAVTSITIGDLWLDDASGTCAVDCTDQAVAWTIMGDVSQTGGGTVTWTRGTGSITASGKAAQDWDWGDLTLPAVIVNKADETLTLSGGFTAASFTHSGGNLDLGGQTVVTEGDLTISAGATVTNTGLDGADITVGGDLSLNGLSSAYLNLGATAGWSIDAAGSARANRATIANLDMSGGASDLRAFRSTDGGSNTEVIFVPFHRGIGSGLSDRAPPFVPINR